MSSPNRNRRRRFEEIGHVRFLTFSCYQRLDLFRNDKVKTAFAEHLEHCRVELCFRLIAWVIMPNHVHLLLVPDLPNCPVPIILQQLKEPFARRVLTRWRSLDAPIVTRLLSTRGSMHFWQRGGGYDRNIVNDKEFFEKLDYIHANPVNANLVEKPTDWQWSSAQWYEGDRDCPVTVEPLNP